MKVAFYKGRKRLFNRLVSWWMRGKYSHAELVFEGGLGKFSLCGTSSFSDGGVRIKTILLDPEHWDVVDLGRSFSRNSAHSWFVQKLGCKYDVLGLIGFVFRRVGDNKQKFFCSESVASALGFDDAWRFDPNTLAAALRTKHKS